MALSSDTQKQAVWPRRMNHWTVRWALLLVLLVAVSWYRFEHMQANPAPPGSDAGNWLAFGRELMGQDVKAARAAYPPVFPAITWWMANRIGPLEAGKVLGSLSSVLSGIPLYLIAVSEAPWGLALVGTAAFLATGYRSEVVAFGGYPQLLAEAFALAALWLFAVGVMRRSLTAVGMGAIFTSLVVGTHHLTSLFLFASLLACSLVLLGQGASGRSIVRMGVWFGLVSAILSVPYAATYYAMVRELSGSPFNAQHWGIGTAGETLSYIFRNSVGLWYALTGVAVTSLVMAGPRPKPILRAVTISILAATVSLFVRYSEVRTLQFLFPGIILGFILAGAILWELPGGMRLRARRALLGAAMLAVTAATVWGGVQFTRQSFPWYQLLDNRRVEALDWLRSNTPEDALIAATASRNGFTLGWWIEGYAGRRTFSGGDPRWMIFQDEKDQTRTANTMFAMVNAGDPQTQEFGESAGISYLVVDKEHWKITGVKDGLRRVFENDAILIIAVSGSSVR